MPMPKRGLVDTLALSECNALIPCWKPTTKICRFMAAEIHLVNLTALLFSNFGFEKQWRL